MSGSTWTADVPRDCRTTEIGGEACPGEMFGQVLSNRLLDARDTCPMRRFSSLLQILSTLHLFVFVICILAQLRNNR